MPGRVAHEEAVADAIFALRNHFGEDGDTFVVSDLVVRHVEGDLRRSLAPDVMVIRGMQLREMGSYRVSQEGTVPGFVLEVLSKGTYVANGARKRTAYARMGVQEYFRYDPLGQTMAREHGGRRLIGERLVDGVYRELPIGPRGTIRSEVLGLDVRVRHQEREPGWRELRFRDPKTGDDLPTRQEGRRQQIAAIRLARVSKEERRRAERKTRTETEARLRAVQQSREHNAARLRAVQKLEDRDEEIQRAKERITELEDRLSRRN